MIVTGGVGIGGGLYVGGNAVITGIANTGALTPSSITTSGTISVTNSTLSTSTSSGAVIVTGGVGVGGNIYVGGNVIAGGISGNGFGVGSVNCMPPTAVTNGLTSGISFYGTFVANADKGIRRTADIISGFSTGIWGTEYMSLCCGSSNDAYIVSSEMIRLTANSGITINTSISNYSTTISLSANTTTVITVPTQKNAVPNGSGFLINVFSWNYPSWGLHAYFFTGNGGGIPSGVNVVSSSNMSITAVTQTTVTLKNTNVSFSVQVYVSFLQIF